MSNKKEANDKQLQSLIGVFHVRVKHFMDVKANCKPSIFRNNESSVMTFSERVLAIFYAPTKYCKERIVLLSFFFQLN